MSKQVEITKGTTLLYLKGQSAWFVAGWYDGKLVLVPVENNRSDVLMMSEAELVGLLQERTWKVL